MVLHFIMKNTQERWFTTCFTTPQIRCTTLSWTIWPLFGVKCLAKGHLNGGDWRGSGGSVALSLTHPYFICWSRIKTVSQAHLFNLEVNAAPVFIWETKYIWMRSIVLDLTFPTYLNFVTKNLKKKTNSGRSLISKLYLCVCIYASSSGHPTCSCISASARVCLI